MTTSKSVNAYPYEFFELATDFEKDTSKEIVIYFGTHKEAMTMRLHFNSYRQAFVRERKNNELPNIEAMNVAIRDNPPRMVITHKDNTFMAKAIREALDRMKKDSE